MTKAIYTMPLMSLAFLNTTPPHLEHPINQRNILIYMYSNASLLYYHCDNNYDDDEMCEQLLHPIPFTQMYVKRVQSYNACRMCNACVLDLHCKSWLVNQLYMEYVE